MTPETGAPKPETLELTLETPQEEAARLAEKPKGVADQLAEANASGDPAVVAEVEDVLAEKYNIPGEKPSDKVSLENGIKSNAERVKDLFGSMSYRIDDMTRKTIDMRDTQNRGIRYTERHQGDLRAQSPISIPDDIDFSSNEKELESLTQQLSLAEEAYTNQLARESKMPGLKKFWE